MNARLLTGYDLQKYVAKRNEMLDAAAIAGTGCPELPTFEAHLTREREVTPGVFVRENAIVVGDDKREVCKMALAEPYPCRTLYMAPSHLAYVGIIGRGCWTRPLVYLADGRKVAA